MQSQNAPKAYLLKFEERPNYLLATVRSETMDREIALAYLSEIAEFAKKQNHRRLIIERDVPVMLPDADLFFVTKIFLEMMSGRRVAFVNPHGEIATDMKFAITIGTNRGANYKLFDDIAVAEKWLTG